MLNTSKIRYKSNSQPTALAWQKPISCAQYFKDTIQEQFTTNGCSHSISFLLCSILQRYDTRAIHNIIERSCNVCLAVLNTSKIRYKSNSQLANIVSPLFLSCAQYFKDTIQEQFTTQQMLRCNMEPLCSILQRYDTRAIHNKLNLHRKMEGAVLNTSKIQYKSNSQLRSSDARLQRRCAQYFKDTIQEQFTTVLSYDRQ